MRMWSADPRIMCTFHLTREHDDLHQFTDLFNNGLNCSKHGSVLTLSPLISTNKLEPLNIFDRHIKIVTEMLERGIDHNSELSVVPLDRMPPDFRRQKLNMSESLIDLLTLCKDCREMATDHAVRGGLTSMIYINRGTGKLSPFYWPTSTPSPVIDPFVYKGRFYADEPIGDIVPGRGEIVDGAMLLYNIEMPLGWKFYETP